jgi:hypothetical protein
MINWSFALSSPRYALSETTDLCAQIFMHCLILQYIEMQAEINQRDNEASEAGKFPTAKPTRRFETKRNSKNDSCSASEFILFQLRWHWSLGWFYCSFTHYNWIMFFKRRVFYYFSRFSHKIYCTFLLNSLAKTWITSRHFEKAFESQNRVDDLFKYEA